MNADERGSPVDLVLTLGVGIAGMALTLPFLWSNFGPLGTLLGAVLFPVTAMVVPAWMFFSVGSFWPAVVCYGGSILVVWGRRLWGRWM